MKRKAVTAITAMVTLSSVLFLTSCDAALDKIADVVASGFDDGQKAMASSYDTGREQIKAEVDAGKRAIGEQIGNLSSELISKDRFLEMAAINMSRYEDVDWDKFIMDYYLTEESVANVNVAGLVKDYLGEIDSVSADFIFSDNGLPARQTKFGTGVTKICYFRRTPDKTDSVILDLKSGKRTKVEADRSLTVDVLFKDGTRTEDDFSSSAFNELVYSLIRKDVFILQNVNDTSNEDKHFELVLEYDDGTVYRLDLQGVDAPVSFDDIIKGMND